MAIYFCEPFISRRIQLESSLKFSFLHENKTAFE